MTPDRTALMGALLGMAMSDLPSEAVPPAPRPQKPPSRSSFAAGKHRAFTRARLQDAPDRNAALLEKERLRRERKAGRLGADPVAEKYGPEAE